KNLPPGTMAYKGQKESTETVFEIMNYNFDDYKIFSSKKATDTYNFKNTEYTTWINVNGLSNIKEIETVGKHYNIHQLILEDIVNTNQRPKIDELEDYIFVVFKMLYFNDLNQLQFEHVSMICGEDYVLMFQESDGDVFDDLRERISTARGRIRTRGADYLMYAILDAVVDNYMSVIEAYGDKIEELENGIFTSDADSNETAEEIQHLKQDILKFRRAIFPLREVINRLEKADVDYIKEATHNFLRDLYDHIIQVTESIEMYREMVWSLMDMHMTLISNKMNEIMKVLTIIATIFIPLTFIAGIYGMNFKNMPELESENGYFILWGVMAILFLFMLNYFRRKKWL
ncbi:MAG: magnesium/cobalt transporter CorA, partial [Bacteroidota bacterium]